MKASYKLLPLVALLAAGCASNQQIAQESHVDSVDATSSQKVAVAPTPPVVSEPELPGVELTAELLNDLILADVAARRGHFDVSVGLYLQLARYTRDPRLAERATRVANYADMNNDALAAANLWVELDPDNVDARQLLTALLVKGGETGVVGDHLERILQAEGESLKGFMSVASLLSRERDKELALKLMTQLVGKRENNADAHYALSHLAVRLGDHDLAVSSVERALELRPDWTDASLHYARALLAKGDAPRALGLLESLLDERPDNFEFRIFYARLLVEQERMDEAFAQFKMVADAQPDNEDALFALGFIGLQIGQLEEAEQALLAMKRTGVRGDEVNYYLGRLEELRDNSEAAQKWYGSITQGEYFINAQIRVIALTAQAGDVEGALQLLTRLKGQRPAQKLRLDLVEGEILVGEQRYQEAMDLYSQALLEVPENGDLLYARSMVAEKLGDIATAEHDLKQILARDPNNVEALNALGYTLADRTTRYEEAYDFISRAIELRPNDYYILDSMGWVKYKLGDYEEALRYLRRALDLKMDAEIAAHLGEVLWVTGDKTGAKEVWQRALDDSSVTSKKTIITDVMERLNQ